MNHGVNQGQATAVAYPWVNSLWGDCTFIPADWES